MKEIMVKGKKYKFVNLTPHVIRFWQKSWAEPVEVESDGILSATVVERPTRGVHKELEYVTPTFKGNESGYKLVAAMCDEYGEDTLLIGSIIAAQAYPGHVVTMVAAPGYERVPPAEKRMRPDKFTVY